VTSFSIKHEKGTFSCKARDDFTQLVVTLLKDAPCHGQSARMNDDKLNEQGEQKTKVKGSKTCESPAARVQSPKQK
jgi:hypothetical protein